MFFKRPTKEEVEKATRPIHVDRLAVTAANGASALLSGGIFRAGKKVDEVQITQVEEIDPDTVSVTLRISLRKDPA